MPSRAEIEAGIRKAYASGHIDLAKRLAGELSKTEETRQPFTEFTAGGGEIMGWTDPAAGLAQLASRVAPDSRTPEMVRQGMPSTKETIGQAVKDREAMYQAPEGFDYRRMAGNIVNPVSAALMGIPVGQAALRARMGAGAGSAGAYGASMPVLDDDFSGSKRKQITESMLMGGAIPLGTAVGGAGVRLADQVTRPFGWRKGLDKVMQTKITPIQRDIVGRISDTLGSGKQKVIQALESRRTPPHLQKMTTGQAIAQANLQDDTQRFGGSLVGLEGEVSRVPEAGLSDKAQTLYKGQRAARRKVLQGIAGDDAKMEALEKSRATVTKPYYEIIDKSTAQVDATPVLSKVDEIMVNNELTDNIIIPMRKIRRKLMKGEDIETSPKALRSLSKDISNKIQAKTPGGQNQYDVATLVQVKKALDKQITEAVPEYEIAQKLYAEQSAPINQMNVAKELIRKIDSADVKEESTKPFLRAAKDEAKIIKAATGFKRGKSLEDIFKGNEKGYKELMSVIEDLDVNVEATKMASELGSVFSGIKTGIEVQAPSVLEREVVLANYLLSKIGKDKTGEFAEVAWGLIEDPKYMAEMLKLPGGYPTAKAIGERLKQALTVGAASTAAGG